LTLLVGQQEGHPVCKKIWRDGGGGHRLVRMEWRPAGWSVCLHLLMFPCTVKSRSSVLAPAHPGGPGKRAVKRLLHVVVWLIDSVYCAKVDASWYSGEVCSERDIRWLSAESRYESPSLCIIVHVWSLVSSVSLMGFDAVVFCSIFFTACVM